jgi:hypothetical protein
MHMSDEGDTGRLGFLAALARLLRAKEEAPPPPQTQTQAGGFAELEADFEIALRRLREKVAEHAATAGPGAGAHRRTAADVAAETKRRIDECHRSIREDIEKMHSRLGTGLSPTDLDAIGALLRDLDADATAGRSSDALMPRLRFSVGTRFRLEAGALAVARLVELLRRAKLEWPDPMHYAPHAKPEEIERSRRRRLAEIRESFLSQDFKRTAERMLGIVQAWGPDYPDRGSPLWEETVLEGVAAGIRGQLLKDFVELVERDRDLVLRRAEAAIGKELAALQTAVEGGVHSIEQANMVVASSLHALDEVVPELVWQHVRSVLPRARGKFAS